MIVHIFMDSTEQDSRGQLPISKVWLTMLSHLRSLETFGSWLDQLDTLQPADVPTASEADLSDFLTFTEVPVEHHAGILATRDTIATDADWQWLFQRCVQNLLAHMDEWEWPIHFHSLPATMGDAGTWFYLHVFAAAYPHTRALYEKHGIPDDIARATLADIGRHVLIHRQRTGEAGLADPDWLELHLRGMIYQIGRLQFERAPLGGTTSRALHAQGYPRQKGHPVLAVHIPSLSGPLSPEACDASFAEADAFFRAHYPGYPLDLAVCKSWLMDRQLADYLPETSNIVQFQRRFQIAYTPEPDNHDTLEFVFRAPNRSLDELPQSSTLERAVVAHIRAGKAWTGGMGWLEWQAR